MNYKKLNMKPICLSNSVHSKVDSDVFSYVSGDVYHKACEELQSGVDDLVYNNINASMQTHLRQEFKNNNFTLDR